MADKGEKIMSIWQTKSSKIVYENPWMVVKEDQIIMPNGKEGVYGYVSSTSNAVFVIPIDNDGNTYIVQQEHYPSRKVFWQFAAGRNDNELAEVAAKRELFEEMGIQAGHIILLGEISSSVGLSTFNNAYCLARDLTITDSPSDDGKGIITMKKVSFQEAKEMILAGEINTSESIALYFLATAHLEKEL
jgi:ADP-ribose pyrophosphatase